MPVGRSHHSLIVEWEESSIDRGQIGSFKAEEGVHRI